MRQFRILSCLMAVLALLVLVTGCDEVKSTYNTLAVSGVTYDATMKAAADAHASGQLSDDQKATLIKYGTAFYGAWHTAREALRIYKATDKPDAASRERLIALGTAALAEWTTFKNYARDMGVLVEGVK